MSTSAIILAAGKGTRMKSSRAKVIFPLAGVSLVERVVRTSLKADCTKICVVVGHQKETVRETLSHYSQLVFADQDQQLGTGHAVMMAAPVLGETDGEVFILCGDVPLLQASTLLRMREAHRAAGAACTVLTMVLEDPGKYGRIVRDTTGSVQRIVEYKDATATEREIQEINTGIYCFDTAALLDSIQKLSDDNAQHEYYLTDTLEILNHAGKKVISEILDDVSEAAGVNSQKQLAELEDEFYARIRDHWMENGVSIELPRTVLIGEDVTIAHDVTIAPGCILRGTTQIGENAYIGPYCWLENTIVGENCRLEGGNWMKHEMIPPCTIVGLREP